MLLSAKWHKEVKLTPSKELNALFDFDLEKIPAKPGIYIFIRSFGNGKKGGRTLHEPVYVGRALNLKARMKTHQNNLKLMLGVKNAGNGSKAIIFCEINSRQGQKMDTILQKMESAIIDHCLTKGFELINVHGAREKYDTIEFKGNRVSEAIVGRWMKVKTK
jgi:hypothetical protein